MFLRAYVELHLPITKVEEALLRTPAEWIPGLASSAEEHGDQLLAEVGFPVGALQLGKRVEIELSARYKPPFGLVGESLDRALLHRVAEATVRDFVERVAGVLRQRRVAA